MKFGLFICILLTGLQAVYNAPVEIKEESKRRETTKETLELEKALKRLAGENKQYYPGIGAQPIPQVDGLDDGDNPEVNVNGINALEKLENQNDETENNLEEIAKETEDEGEDNEELKNEKDQMEMDEIQPSDDGDDDYQAIPNYYPEQETYDNSYDYRNSYPYYGNRRDFDNDGLNEDYAVQDVMQLLEDHPELFSQILQAKGELQQELQTEEEQVSNSNLPEDDVYNAELQTEKQFENAPNENDEDMLDEMKAMQQYEKLQELYGDSDAHVVAKKMVDGPTNFQEFYHTNNDANDGSGDLSAENETNRHEIDNQVNKNIPNDRAMFERPVM